MVEVYDLESSSISEILLLAANPPGLEDRLVPEGKTIEEHLPEDEIDLLYTMVREKLQNTRGQRRAIMSIIDEHAFGNRHPSGRVEFSTDEELMDYITEEVWPQVYREVKGIETRFFRKKGKDVTNIWEDSTVLRRTRDYRHPNEMQPWKATARSTDVSVAISQYEDSNSHLPILRQTAEKRAKSTGEKWEEKLKAARMNNEPLNEVPQRVRDYIKGMLVTMYGPHDSGVFANPNRTESTPDPQSNVVDLLWKDPRIKVVGFDDYYEQPTTHNWQRTYLRLSDEAIEHDKTGKIIRYPKVYSGKEVISFVLMDSRNYFSYFFGPESHTRAKMRHKYGVHKDSLDGCDKEIKRIAKESGQNVERTLRGALSFGVS